MSDLCRAKPLLPPPGEMGNTHLRGGAGSTTSGKKRKRTKSSDAGKDADAAKGRTPKESAGKKGKDDDASLVRRWLDLRKEATDFVADHLPAALQPAFVKSRSFVPFRKLASETAAMVQQPALAPTVMEAKAWETLSRTVFALGATYWDGGTGVALAVRDVQGQVYETNDVDTVQAFYKWRSDTIKFVYEHLAVRSKHASTVDVIVEELLEPYYPGYIDDAKLESAESAARRLVEHAVEVDLLLRQARHGQYLLYFTVAGQKFDAKRNSNRLEFIIGGDASKQKEPTVDLCLVPGLGKIANCVRDPEVAGELKVLARSTVVCDVPQSLLKSR